MPERVRDGAGVGVGGCVGGVGLEVSLFGERGEGRGEWWEGGCGLDDGTDEMTVRIMGFWRGWRGGI